jgi:serine/threonine-protein kinase
MSSLPPTVGRYEVIRLLGKGGMGKVLLAFDPLLERQVTVKLLTDVEDREQRSRFTREARSAARLRHPNIVKIFDVGEDNGQPFIAMEYIHGQTLEQIIKRGEPLTLVRKLQLMEEACAGLGYAHKSGIVHRDVKPANLMVDSEGILQILDFGVVHVAGSGMTQSGMIMGTFQYMSPEQLSGSPIDQRSDLFALGSVFYELLSGRQAFPGSFHDGLFNRILHEPPEPLATLCPDLPADVIAIVNRALQKAADQRYGDATAMRVDIQNVRRQLEGEPGFDPTRTSPGAVTHLRDYRELANEALNAGNYEQAVVAAEEVLNLKPQDSGADAILERARIALDKLQVNEWLEEAAAKIASNDLSNAESLVDQALSLAPGSNRGVNLKAMIEEARRGAAAGVTPAPAVTAVAAGAPSANRYRNSLIGLGAIAAIVVLGVAMYSWRAATPDTAVVQGPAPGDVEAPSAAANPPPMTSVPVVPDPIVASPQSEPRRDSSAPPPRTAAPAVAAAAAVPPAPPESKPESPPSAAPNDRVLAEARTAAATARRDADAAGAPAIGSASYKSALQLESDAARFVIDGRNDDAARVLYLAAGLFKSAAATPPVSTSAPVPAPVPPPVPADTRPALPDPPPPSSAPSTAVEEEAIRATLRAYERAFNELDAAAVKRVYPNVDANALASAFAQLRTQAVAIRSERIRVTGNTALVTCTIVQSFTPKVGSGRETSVSAEFQLNKSAGGWVITSRK